MLPRQEIAVEQMGVRNQVYRAVREETAGRKAFEVDQGKKSVRLFICLVTETLTALQIYVIVCNLECHESLCWQKANHWIRYRQRARVLSMGTSQKPAVEMASINILSRPERYS